MACRVISQQAIVFIRYSALRLSLWKPGRPGVAAAARVSRACWSRRQASRFGAALADSFFETLLKVFIFGVLETIFIGDLFADHEIFETLVHGDHAITAAGLHDRQQLIALVFLIQRRTGVEPTRTSCLGRGRPTDKPEPGAAKRYP